MLAEQQKANVCSMTMSRTNQSKSVTMQQQHQPQARQMDLSYAITANVAALEKIYSDIYLISDRNEFSANDLKLFGFTHIIYIDKHISENAGSVDDNGNSNKSAQPIDRRILTSPTVCEDELLFGGPNFEILDLNFGESTYLTTVLPSCYKAVKFIEKALTNNGAVLVIDSAGNKQKCVTIVVGYLMYRYNKNFTTAYHMLKRFHPNIELDRFFISQLNEYEPILQMQRTQSGGNSCSRELRSALLKRKKPFDEYHSHHTEAILPSTILCAEVFRMSVDQTDILME